MAEIMNGLEVSNLAINTATLIFEGYKTFDKCHVKLKLDCAICLILWGAEDLITEEEYLNKAKEKIAEAQANQ